MHKGLLQFCKKAKKLGYKVKVDTNGSFPAMLKELIDEKAADYIAMDVKGTKEKYSKIAGTDVDLEKIQKSIQLLMKSGIEYEFRMTVIQELHSEKDIIAVGKWLKGAKQFYLQNFKDDVPLLDSNAEKMQAYSKENLLQFVEALRPYFGHVGLRGI